jgi:hypothetical protein
MRLSYSQQPSVSGDGEPALSSVAQQTLQMPGVPMWSRSAIHASGIVVCERNSETNSTFLGSPFQRAVRSVLLLPIRKGAS